MEHPAIGLNHEQFALTLRGPGGKLRRHHRLIHRHEPVFAQGGTLFTDTKATIYLSGGTLAKEYTLENRIVTAAGRKYSRRIAIAVQAK